MKRRIYLDHNATAPLCGAAREAMLALLGPPGNASALNAEGREACRRVEDAREAVARLAGWAPQRVIFTSGATEANTLALHTGVWAGPSTEHPSVLDWLAVRLPVDGDGILDPDALSGLEGVTGLSVMVANNETGVLQPVESLILAARKAGLRVHVDASQAPGRIPITVQPDYLTLSAHKFGGPTGVGALLVGSGAPVQPVLRGGPQERRRRAGTHNLPGIVGMGAAAAALRTVDPRVQAGLEAALRELGARIIGADAPRLPNTTCAAFPGLDAADLVMALDLEGVATSSGAACASGSPEPSHVLRAMGIPGSALRFSTGPDTTTDEVWEALDRLRVILDRCR